MASPINKNAGMKDQTVLITGGSRGIGFELARLFLKEGAKVILVASDPQRLSKAGEELEREFKTKPYLIVADLSNEDAPKEIFQTVAAQKFSVDVLVNNAGIGVYGKFREKALDRNLKTIDINIKALVALTYYFIPSMVEKKRGKILNVASTAAFQAVPLEAVYGASKSFVLNFSEALANELEGTGVNVSCLCPGPTHTGFFSKDKFIASKIVKKYMMTSHQTAQWGMKALRENRVLVIAGFRNQLVQVLERAFPRKWITKLARRMVE